MPTTTMNDLENKLLDKLQALGETVAKLSEDIARMTVKVENIADALQEARQHGERIRGLEADVANLKSNEKSAATERRWIIGVLISAAIAAAALLFQVWGNKAHP